MFNSHAVDAGLFSEVVCFKYQGIGFLAQMSASNDG